MWAQARADAVRQLDGLQLHGQRLFGSSQTLWILDRAWLGNGKAPVAVSSN
jgi:hypothetical protein